MQKDNFLKFFDQSAGAFFRLQQNGVVVKQETQNDSKEANKSALDEAFDFLIMEGDKIELTVSKSSNFTGGVKMVRYNTSTGKFERAKPQTPAGFQGSESSFMQGWQQGYTQGEIAGRMAAQMDYMREKMDTPDKPGLLENIASTEQGAALLAAVAQKLGVL